MDIGWKTGFEIELLAPKGRSRRDLAEAIARRVGGSVRPCFYPQSEPGLAPGVPVFENLILGFEAIDKGGRRIALCVDDLTIRADLHREAEPVPGWLRILSDDPRMLSLAIRHCNPLDEVRRVLEPLAEMFGTEVEFGDGVAKVCDAMRRPVAMAAGVPGERERPCELVTAPIAGDQRQVLEALIAPATELGFTVPAEAAVHVHFEAAPLRNAATLARLAPALAANREWLRRAVRTNPACVRLGPVPEWLVATVSSPGFRSAGWDEARAMLADGELSKYCDFNFLNLVHDTPGKPTFEVRILPGSMDAAAIAEQAALFGAILRWAASGKGEIPHDPASLLAELEMPDAMKWRWLERGMGRG